MVDTTVVCTNKIVAGRQAGTTINTINIGLINIGFGMGCVCISLVWVCTRMAFESRFVVSRGRTV